jgi:DNA-binding MarR family transcriptional regulator
MVEPTLDGYLTRPWHTLAANAYVVYWAIRRQIEAGQIGLPVDPLCAVLLRAVSRNLGAMPMGSLRYEFGLPASTLSSAVNRLERDGLAFRTETYGDRRGRIVELTAAGRTAAASVNAIIDRIESDADMAVGEFGRMGFNMMANVIATLQDAPDYWPWLD